MDDILAEEKVLKMTETRFFISEKASKATASNRETDDRKFDYSPKSNARSPNLNSGIVNVVLDQEAATATS